MLLLLTTLSWAEEPGIWETLEAEKGGSLSEQEVEAARELADERFDEQRFLGAGALGRQPDLRIYSDPVAALAVDPLHLGEIDPDDFDIPIDVNPMVEKWMRYFTGRGRKWFERYLGRESRYAPMMDAAIEDAGLPKDLVYVSMIESGYSNTARSYASAVGLWQFMAPTARAYGLRVDYWADERVDPEASTRAALAYLADLYQLQDDWYLAWASYNAGPGRVNGAIKRHGTRDFWVLAQQDTLAAETRNYVPKVIAAAIVGKYPERYGFTDIEPVPELRYQSVEVHGAVSLDVIADCAGSTEEEIVGLNPSLLRGATPPDGTTSVHLPEGATEGFAACFEAIPPSERISYRRHEVRRGETLSGIASKHGVSSGDIAKVNRISDPSRIYVGMELVIPLHGTAPEMLAEPPRTTTVHTVRSGDTLSAIATRYGVSTDDVVSWNGLGAADHIQVGQKLTIRGGDARATAQLTYTVKAGDTLSEIAREFGVSTSQVMEWNGIRDAAKVPVGKTLKLYGPSGDWKIYKVRPGDSLGAIAQANGCSVGELKGWNDLSGSTIHPGQTLRIRED